MTSRPFRFGISLLGGTDSRAGWQAKARQAEELGYDVITVPDHLGMPAPFPALVSAAAATKNIRLGTYVLNAAFYRPALLARDVADTNHLTDGRLELGLGAGYNEPEFDAAGLPFHRAGKRIDDLGETVAALRGMVDPLPPLMLAGAGDRMLRLAAREADIVGFTVLDPRDDGEATLAERVEFVRGEAGDRLAGLELNLFLFATVVSDGEPDLALVRGVLPHLSDDQIRALPGVLIGSAQQIAETLLRYRETYGLSYFGLVEPFMTDFAKVIDLLR